MDTPLLVAFSEGLARAGFPVLRFNFLYTEHGRKAPDRQETLMDTWGAAHAFFKEALGPRAAPIVAAGKSLGGRIASMMAAEGLLSLKGLIFLGYPLHPADNKEKLRDEHLYRISIPMLFFAGTRDPLCDLARLEPVLKRLNAPWTLSTVEGGDHSFHAPKSKGLTEAEIYSRIVEESEDWLSKLHK
jgi:predicted alpha/beta-hydrolase family hydrolase